MLASGRHPVYVASRFRAIAARYGLGSAKAKARIRRCLRALDSRGLQPTFATPGAVVEREGAFFRELRDTGAEMAVHGYDHANFRRLTRTQAEWQFARAIEAYSVEGIPCEGFRCPYLSYTDDVRAILPEGVFAYSSNRAIAWPVVSGDDAGPVFEQLARNYGAGPAAEQVCTPALDGALVEIPASVPDDLQLADGLGLGTEGLVRAWSDMLDLTHEREELFAPLFHPEAFDLFEDAALELLAAAGRRRPAVWLTQLRHVAGWWRELAGFQARMALDDGAVVVDLDCSERATVLARGRHWDGNETPWDGAWFVLAGRRLRIEDGTRPFVGAVGLDLASVRFLREQGYIVDDGEHAGRCGIVLDADDVERLGSRRALVDEIEHSTAPLVRYSRWPGGAKSAICLAGDLDALSWRDYAARLHPAVRARSG